MGIYWAEMADKNQTEKQIQFLKTYLKLGGYVLDLACGSGRHSMALAADGLGMVGLDSSRRLLRIANERSRSLALVLGDMRYLPFRSGVFTAALSVDTSFGYLPSEADDKSSLTEVNRVLFQRAIFVIDVFNQENLVLKYNGQNTSVKEKEYPSFFLQQKRIVRGDGGWLFDSWIIRDKEDGQVRFFEHKVRLYGREKLQRLLEEAGFEVEEVYGSYERTKFSIDSPKLILIANAK